MMRSATTAALLLMGVPAPANAYERDRALQGYTVGASTATSRRETFQNAIAVHDSIAAQLRSRPLPTPHPFWNWLCRVTAVSAAVGLAYVAVTANGSRKVVMTLATLVVAATALDVVLPMVASSVMRPAADRRTRDAEWLWRLDLARASTLTDVQAKSAAIRAAQRYHAAAAMR